jgi:hypothetical protein
MLLDKFFMQSNKIMVPFRTKGFHYFDKMYDIMPNTTARGGHAFSAMRTMPPPSLNETAELDILDESAENRVESDTHMNTYGDNNGWTFTSMTSAGKRKLSAITPDDDDSEMATDIPSITSELATSSTSFEPGPASKKITNPSPFISTSSTSRSIPKSISSSLHPKPKAASAPSLRSQPRSFTSKTSTKLTPELLVHEMQGSITSLASAVRDSAATDPVAKLRQDAVHALSVRDDGLSVMDKIAIIELFRTDYASVQTYLALLEHDEIRKQWLLKQLD